MRQVMVLNPAWWEIVRISARGVSAYRFAYLASLVALAIRLVLLRAIWTAIYDGEASLDGVSAQAQLVFITITTLQGLVFTMPIAWTIQGQVTSGKVALDLIRPLGFIQQILGRQVGNTVGHLPFVLVMIPFALLIGSLRMPDLANLGPYLVSVVLAYMVSVLTWMLVGMLAFWIMQVNAVRALLQVASELLGGALVPLWFMPDGLRFVLELLPFQAILFLPAAIYTGEVSGTGLVRPFLVQLTWIVLLWWIAALVWRRAQRRIVIQGG
jgi:ABC-2 type transport system permease protein